MLQFNKTNHKGFQNHKGFIAKYIFMYEEFVLVFGARDIYKQQTVKQ